MKNNINVFIKTIGAIIIVILIFISINQYRTIKLLKHDFGNTLLSTQWELGDNVQYIKDIILTNQYSDSELMCIHRLIELSTNISKIEYNLRVSKGFERMDCAINSYFNKHKSREELNEILKLYILQIEKEFTYDSNPLNYYDLTYKHNS